MATNEDKVKGFLFFGFGFIVVLIMVIIFMNMGFDTVNANEIGVMRQFGEIKGIMYPGMRWTGLFTDVITYSTALRKTEVGFAGDQAAWDSQKRNIYLDVSVNWKIKPESVNELYSQVPLDSNIESMLNVKNIISESVKQVTPRYDVENLQNDREKIKEEIKTQIVKNFPSQFLQLENVVVANVDVSPEYKKEINDAATATVKAEKEKLMIDVVKYQQAQETETKKGEVERQKLVADANFYSAQKDADGTAYKILADAKAEAEGFRLKRLELTKELVNMAMVQKWSGNYPDYLIVPPTGSSFLMSLPSAEGG
ncbi:MAG: SPFH domain-containing protein [archaeon]